MEVVFLQALPYGDTNKGATDDRHTPVIHCLG